MTKPTTLETRITAIESRNSRVSADKAWETSATRRLSIAVLTYLVVSTYLTVIHNNQPYINAFVPVFGYLLSTLVLSRVRELWTSRRLGR